MRGVKSTLVLCSCQRRCKEPPTLAALDDSGIITVSGKHVVRRRRKGVLDHLEQRVALRLAVDDPVGVEDFVTAVLGVGLGKHHQLNVAGVTPQFVEGVYQVINFIFCQRQPQRLVGCR